MIRFRLSVIVSLFVFLFIVSLPAFTQDFRFRRLSIEDGLSQSTVNCILQDSRGFMWFGTQDGLNRYDGYSFSVYRNDPSDTATISDNHIKSLYEDRSGRLWIGTNGGGVNRFDPKTLTFSRFAHDPRNPSSLSNNAVWSFCEDRSGRLWIGTEDGLNLYDENAGTFERFRNDPGISSSLSHNFVWVIHRDHSERLWIGTDRGLNRYDESTKSFVRFLNAPDNPLSISDNRIYSICEDRSGRLWLATYKGLNRLDETAGSFERFLHDPDKPGSLSSNSVWYVHEEGDGQLWVGTDGGGLNLLDVRTKTFRRFLNEPHNSVSLPNNTVFCIFREHSGRLWIGTSGGPCLLDLKPKRFIHYKNEPGKPASLSQNRVWAIYKDRNRRLWAGTNDEGLNLLSTETVIEVFRHNPRDPSSLSEGSIHAICEDRSGRLWIGTEKGLNQFQEKTKTFRRYIHDPRNPSSISVNNIYAILEDRSGRLWIGTGGGLNRMDKETGIFTRFMSHPQNPGLLPNDRIWALYEDRAGRLWIGTDDGLSLMNTQTNTFEYFKNDPRDPASLSNNHIWCVTEDSKGRLWIGTRGGLNLMDVQQKSFRAYREKNGLANDMIYGILEDGQGRLWLSTNKGLTRFDTETGACRNYDVTDGLQSNEFNCFSSYKDPDGIMYFGGINGFNAFHPDSIRDDDFIPPVTLTRLTLFNQPVETGKRYNAFVLPVSIAETDELVLSYREQVFSLEFAALSYVYPEKSRYAYRLEGFDDDWTFTDSKKRFATYTNLDAGRYIFHVKGTNHDGIWNEKGHTLRIIITPPWWKTWWAYGIYVLMFFLGVTGYVRMQVNKSRLKARQMLEKNQEQARLREAELQAQAAETQARSQQAEIENAKQIARINVELAEKNRQLEILNSQMEKTVGIVRELNSAIALNDVVKSILEKTQAITRVRKGSVLAWDSVSGKYRFRACIGVDFKQLESIELTREEAYERYLKGGTEIEKDIWMVRNITGRTAEEKFGAFPPMESLLVVCLRGETRIEGYLLFDDVQFSDLDGQEVLLLKSLTEHLRWAIVKARLLEESRRINDQKNEFLGIAAHDLRNPLSSITGYTELMLADLQSGPPDALNLENDIRTVDSIARQMAAFIADLLDMASIESGKVRIEKNTESIGAIIKNLYPLHSRRAEQKHIRLTVEPMDHLPSVMIDRLKISSVIDNLVSNAVKYTNPGGAVRVYGESADTEILIHVEDNGQGLTPVDMEKIFNTFTRLSAKPTGNETSTGLGLAIVKKIVNIHGGRVWVKSEPGKGSTFSFSIPRTDALI